MDSMFGGKLEQLLSDEDAMSKIREIANSLSLSNAQPQMRDMPPDDRQPPPPPPPPPGASVGGYCAILSAIKPYLDKERCERADKLIRMMRIAEMAKSFIKL